MRRHTFPCATADQRPVPLLLMHTVANVSSTLLVICGTASELILWQRSKGLNVDSTLLVLRKRLWAFVIVIGLFGLIMQL